MNIEMNFDNPQIFDMTNYPKTIDSNLEYFYIKNINILYIYIYIYIC
jgi:hypothetical protein